MVLRSTSIGTTIGPGGTDLVQFKAVGAVIILRGAKHIQITNHE